MTVRAFGINLGSRNEANVSEAVPDTVADIAAADTDADSAIAEIATADSELTTLVAAANTANSSNDATTEIDAIETALAARLVTIDGHIDNVIAHLVDAAAASGGTDGADIEVRVDEAITGVTKHEVFLALKSIQKHIREINTTIPAA